MIDYKNVEGKAYVECYTLEDLLQETLELGAHGYKLCLENDYFCFNRGGNYTAHFDAPTSDEAARIVDPEVELAFPHTDDPRTIADIDREIKEQNARLGNTPSDVNTAAEPPVQEEASEAGSKEASLYDQLVEGMEALQADREGAISLPRTQPVSPELDATPTDVNDAVTPPATDATPTPRRGRPPRNAT